VAALARALVSQGSSWLDETGRERPLGWEDVVIVAPYNAQVAAIERLLPAQARVGTVDKFQGQDAAVSIYSMTSSTADDAPRGMAFLYSRNRLNVATSRARCVAIVVASPALVQARARTPEQMRLAPPGAHHHRAPRSASRRSALATGRRSGDGRYLHVHQDEVVGQAVHRPPRSHRGARRARDRRGAHRHRDARDGRLRPAAAPQRRRPPDDPVSPRRLIPQVRRLTLRPMAARGTSWIATSKLTSKAQTVVPRAIRERLGLRPGDTVRYRITKTGVLIDKRPDAEDDPFVEFVEWAGAEDEKAFKDL
jgi:bifunctional DNA-binding transcriptional regulator/antitoxin component of YhaV-PrlF toxin-antitoxin module